MSICRAFSGRERTKKHTDTVYAVCKEHRDSFMKLLFRRSLRNELMLALRSGLHHWIYASTGEKKILAPLGRIKLCRQSV